MQTFAKLSESDYNQSDSHSDYMETGLTQIRQPVQLPKNGWSEVEGVVCSTFQQLVSHCNYSQSVADSKEMLAQSSGNHQFFLFSRTLLSYLYQVSLY